MLYTIAGRPSDDRLDRFRSSNLVDHLNTLARHKPVVANLLLASTSTAPIPSGNARVYIQAGQLLEDGRGWSPGARTRSSLDEKRASSASPPWVWPCLAPGGRTNPIFVGHPCRTGITVSLCCLSIPAVGVRSPPSNVNIFILHSDFQPPWPCPGLCPVGNK